MLIYFATYIAHNQNSIADGLVHEPNFTKASMLKVQLSVNMHIILGHIRHSCCMSLFMVLAAIMN